MLKERERKYVWVGGGGGERWDKDNEVVGDIREVTPIKGQLGQVWTYNKPHSEVTDMNVY